MNPLVLVWTTVCLWTTGSRMTQIDIGMVTYLPLNETATLACDCSDRSCQKVYWFRTSPENTGLQFLVSLNNADRRFYGTTTDQMRFKPINKKDVGSKSSFTLRITNVVAADAGLYSCMLENKKDNELFAPGVLLKPGVTPTSTTLPPVTKPQTPSRVKPSFSCIKTQTQKGCHFMILWVLVGALLALAVALLSTMYYFSRLPKKCRHQFVKKRALK
ncbi:hypothetical protein DPEC_G00197150 [Dallia pectoralis]|uniref:Uncharacterized protein n=1 Tax=Dallia pectoralis TaxID=75939 RepID=A0ACC2G7T6_DALPE|nr:hypothetical protein DPEC_G00197150 [Dallia pectoralis]